MSSPAYFYVLKNTKITTLSVEHYSLGEFEIEFTFPANRYHQVFFDLILPARGSDELFPPTFKIWKNGEIIENTQSNRTKRIIDSGETITTYKYKMQLETVDPGKSCYVSLYVSNWPEEEKKFNLLVEVKPGGRTEPPRGGYQISYPVSEPAPVYTITAIPNDGCQFQNWILDGQTQTTNPISIVIDRDHNLTAYFTCPSPPPITPEPPITLPPTTKPRWARYLPRLYDFLEKYLGYY